MQANGRHLTTVVCTGRSKRRRGSFALVVSSSTICRALGSFHSTRTHGLCRREVRGRGSCSGLGGGLSSGHRRCTRKGDTQGGGLAPTVLRLRGHARRLLGRVTRLSVDIHGRRVGGLGRWCGSVCKDVCCHVTRLNEAASLCYENFPCSQRRCDQGDVDRLPTVYRLLHFQRVEASDEVRCFSDVHPGLRDRCHLICTLGGRKRTFFRRGAKLWGQSPGEGPCPRQERERDGGPPYASERYGLWQARRQDTLYQ